MFKFNLIFGTLLIISFGCSETKSGNQVSLEESKEIITSDSTIFLSIQDTSIEDLKSDIDSTQPEILLEGAALDYSNYVEEEWANVPNPFIAYYRGNSFGDYHHIMFEDDNGVSYDFGDGDNDFGDCELFFEDEHLTDNPKYLNKKMEVNWTWKQSTFPCCEGEYELTTAKMPSIIKLELKD